MLAKLTWSLAFVAAIASTVRANDLTYNTTAGPIAVGATGVGNVPRFDPSLGVLRSVRINVLGLVSGTWGVENTSNLPENIGGYASGEYVGVIMPITLPAGFMYAPNPAFLPDPGTPLTPFDGTLDYGGTSGLTYTFANESGDGSPGQSADVYMDADLPGYVGSGNIAIMIGPLIAYGPYIPPSLQSTVSITATGSIQVRYTYDGFPTRICRAAPFSGCPCNNPSSNGIGGCANSLNSTGGMLDALGTASLSADSLVLSGTNMTNSSALYFQGSTYSNLQTVYGDGLRCVGGSIVRLGTKVNASGISQYPEPNDPSVSVRGGVAQPGQEYYQVVYRDLGNFCTASAFNATSGMAVLWTP